MNEKFPFGYDLNAYIDKAFEQMKALSTWAGPILNATLASKSSWASEENNCNLTGDMKKMTSRIK